MFQVPAQAYDRWIGRYSPQLAAALIEFAGIEPELKALDVGCGPGALSSALVGRVVVNFMSDPEAGVREMARVTRAGGVVAACVWDYGGEMTLLRAFWESA